MVLVPVTVKSTDVDIRMLQVLKKLLLSVVVSSVLDKIPLLQAVWRFVLL